MKAHEKPVFGFLVPLVCALAACARLGAAVSSSLIPAGRTVQLPPFIVSEQPNWSYVKGPDFEILSLCDAHATMELANTQIRLSQLLDAVLPQQLRPKRDVPMLILAFTKSPKHQLSQDAVMKLLHSGHPAVAPRPSGPHVPTERAYSMYGSAPIPIEAQIAPNLLLRDRDQLGVLTLLPKEGFNHATLTVATDYLVLLAKERTPPLPEWFLLGLTDLGSKISFARATPARETVNLAPAKWVASHWQANAATEEFRILTWKKNLVDQPAKIDLAEKRYADEGSSKWEASEWVPTELSEASKTKLLSLEELRAIKDPLAFDDQEVARQAREFTDAPPVSVNKLFPPDILPLAEFFNRAPPAETGEQLLWQAQASLLIRWMLDPGAHDSAANFVKFIDGASRERVTEDHFRACFGLSFAEGEKALAAYARMALRTSLKLPARTLVRSVSSSRPATQAEIARIKGELERLEAVHVRKQYPEFAEKYLEQSRRTFALGENEPGGRDVRWLASAGLSEAEAGHHVRARELLEAAVQGGVVRPHAYWELARLRLLEARLHPLGEEEMLSAAQTESVLQLLSRAREQAPPLPEVYILIAETWIESTAIPTRQQLAALDEGVRLFPKRLALIFAAAYAYAQHGFRDEAMRLANAGSSLAAGDATAGGRFEQLRFRLSQQPPVSAP